MAESFLGEIRIFAGNYAPRNWALCDGQILAVNDYQALFSLLGTTYGGDGRISFGLPDLRGRLPMHMGTGTSLTPRSIGARSGTETVVLTENQIPAHTHSWEGSIGAASTDEVSGAVLADSGAVNIYNEPTDEARIKDLSPNAVEPYGGSQGHYNLMPYTCLNFVMCIKNGTYPSRN